MGGVPTGIERWLPVIVVSIAALPVAVLVVVALTRHRRGRPDALRRSVAEVAMVVGTLPWIWMIFTPLPETARRVRLVPLLDLANLVTGEAAFAFVQIVGNLCVFAAFGFFAPWRWSIGAAAVTAVAAAGSATIELTQYALGIGRVASVDDVLLNAAGAGLAALVSRAVLARQPRTERSFSAGLTSG
jgi:glycopeptide antibiotics resistance protein